MNKFYNLKPGDEIRVIAPARSLKLIGKPNTDIATKALEDMGFKVTFGKYVNDADDRLCASIEKRASDFNEAFKDKNVKAILTVIGGFDSNKILPYIDWEIVAKNPKVFCGFSDITSLHLAIQGKTKMPTFYGPHFSSFGMIKNGEYIQKQFKKMFLCDCESFKLEASELWSDDLWFVDQNKRELEANEGWWILNKGTAKGKIFGGNQSTIKLIQDTQYFPTPIEDTILVIEDVDAVDYNIFERNLVSFIQTPWFKHIKGLMIGRFCKGSKINFEDLKHMIETKKELANMPVVGNIDFGHSMPLSVIPLGLVAEMKVTEKDSEITVFK